MVYIRGDMHWGLGDKDGRLDERTAVLHFDHPSDMVLTTYQRFAGGTVFG